VGARSVGTDIQGAAVLVVRTGLLVVDIAATLRHIAGLGRARIAVIAGRFTRLMENRIAVLFTQVYRASDAIINLRRNSRHALSRFGVTSLSAVTEQTVVAHLGQVAQGMRAFAFRTNVYGASIAIVSTRRNVGLIHAARVCNAQVVGARIIVVARAVNGYVANHVFQLVANVDCASDRVVQLWRCSRQTLAGHRCTNLQPVAEETIVTGRRH